MPAIRPGRGPSVLRVLIPCLLLLPVAGPGADRPHRVEAVEIPAGDLSLGGLLYTDPGPIVGPHPAVILLHGWLPAGSHGAAYVSAAAYGLQQKGYTALALSMRGWRPSGGRDDCGGRQTDDILAALDWLAQRPEVEPRAMALLGYSQGGQVALLAAARAAGLGAVVAYAAPTELARWQETTDVAGIVDYVDRVCSAGEGLGPRSPVHAAASITSPVLLVHGQRDTRVPVEQSLLMQKAMLAAGRKVRVEFLEDADHGLTGLEYLGPAQRFIARQLCARGRRPVPQGCARVLEYARPLE